MRKRILISATIFVLSVGVSFAQSNAPMVPGTSQMNVSPDQANSKDAMLTSAPPVPSDQQQHFQQDIKDIHFEFNRAELRDEDRTILASDADWLKSHPDVLVTLEGDADERGDIVYNVVLSAQRASVTRDALVDLGVPTDRIVFSTGWGKLYPVCSDSDESCWSQNRRTHLATWPPVDEPTRVASR
jgi:peptidoglycan-associated lipoprotein